MASENQQQEFELLTDDDDWSDSPKAGKKNSLWNTNAVVVKSNDLLTAKTNLTLNELRIILVAISKIDSMNPEVRGDASYWVSAKELREIGSERSKAYKYLQNAVNTLYNRSVIRTFGSNGKERDEFRWISKVSYRSGMIGLTFSQEVLPFLTRIRSNFIRYPIKQISELKSVSTLRFFELCVRWRGQVKKMTITELKDILNIPQKKLNGDVARIVRECAAKINEATKIDFHVECEFVRTGRKFTHIIFSVKNRPNILVERTQSVPPEDVPDVRDLVGYSDDDWQNLTLSDGQRNYFASLLSRHNDGGVGNRFAGEFINAAGREGYSQESWKRWIENHLADPKFVYEARVYLHDLGFKPSSAVKKNVKKTTN